MTTYEDLERDENGVTYFEVVGPGEDQASMLIASRSQVDNYRLTKWVPRWTEVAALVDYFIGESAPDRMYHVTFEQAREIAERWGAELITEGELNPDGKALYADRYAGHRKPR